MAAKLEEGEREGEGVSLVRSFVPLNYCRRHRARGRPPQPSLSFDCSPTQEIPLSRNGSFGIYSLIIFLKSFAYDFYSNVLCLHNIPNEILLLIVALDWT